MYNNKSDLTLANPDSLVEETKQLSESRVAANLVGRHQENQGELCLLNLLSF